MARIRTIKPDFWTSEQIVDCSMTARLLFIGIWNFSDDGGNIQYSPKQIKMQVFPGDDFTTKQAGDLIQELIDNKLLIAYEAGGKKYLHVTGWQHQKIDKPTYKYPKFDDNSTITQREVNEPSPPEGKGRESKGKEYKGREVKGDPSAGILHKTIIKIYTDWYETPQMMGVKYKFAGVKDGEAVKKIITYLKTAISEKNKSPATNQEVINAWKFILFNYSKWDKWQRSRLDLAQVNSNLNGILISIKGLKDGKTTRQKIDEINAKVDEMYAQ